MRQAMLVQAEQLLGAFSAVVFDCRFSLQEPDQGRALYRQGHLPGAHYLHLNEDLSAPLTIHGGRHPLPEPASFIATLAAYGVGPNTDVIAYDDSRFAYGSRLWWMMRSVGFKPPRLLNGGYQAWLEAGGKSELDIPAATACSSVTERNFESCCDIEGLRQLQGEGALVVDSRESRRFMGLEEPIDPVAGHIPGAINRPWQNISTAAGTCVDESALRSHWGDALAADKLVVYCGSGVTACVNLFSLALLGRDDAVLYAGSWSDWCSHL